MKQLVPFLLLSSFLSALSCSAPTPMAESGPAPWLVWIPAGGNSWVTDGMEKDEAVISSAGILPWADPGLKIRTYFRVEQAGTLRIGLRARVPEGQSTLNCTFNGISREIKLLSAAWDSITIGTFQAPQPGYYWLEIQGSQRSGTHFAEISDLLLGDKAALGRVYFVRDEFYWGRRGPSVHLRYEVPGEAPEAEWFYSEITVPEGQDVQGSYFMANGFGEGYFGIQVNSPTERRVLFSVWSPYATDNPAEIPETHRIRLLRKGPSVYSGEFGNEGAGGQSFLRYPWKAGNAYRFLLHAKPNGDNTTDFTAYFYAPEEGRWLLIASFRRPQTNTYLRNLYAFLENFLPETGYIPRMGLYANQWVADPAGRWHEVTSVRFTADNTAKKQARLDYAGGPAPEGFFLKNCGFFNETTLFGSTFSRPPSERAPEIDFSKLP
ncbi:MAG: DUF3472 domain-containing protein [Haliscomenobacter sp.]|nr:DUF3472 domain-containing protein [Haliscomenobacter sp.]